MIRLLVRLFYRMGWQGGLQWFVLALSICVASVLSVALVSDRLSQSMNVSGRDFLAADIVLQTAEPVDPKWVADAKLSDIQVAHTTEFSTMLLAGDFMQLASVKAVEDGYPFYGKLELNPAKQIRPGELWLSDSLLRLLQVKPGDLVQLGSTTLKVSGELVQEPDQSFNPLALAPRAMMHQADLGAAQIILPGSRVTHRLLLHGPQQALDNWILKVTPLLKPGQRLLKPEDSNRNLSRQLERSERFFQIASLIGLLLGAVAMTIAINHFSRHTQTMLALLKTFGSNRQQILFLLGGLLLLLTLSGIAIGLVAGWGIHLWMIQLLGNVLPPDLRSISLLPFIVVLLTATVMVFCLVLIPVLRLLDVPALRVLRQEQESKIPTWLTLPILLSALLGVNYLLLKNAVLVMGLFVGIALLMLLLGGLGFILLRLLPKGTVGSSFYLAVQHWQRQPLAILNQLSGIALALLLLGVVISMRVEIVSGFRTFLPANAPNRFLINISDFDKPALETFLKQRHISHAPLYPIVRGRLIQINQDSVTQTGDENGRKGIHRELTMTAQAHLSSDSPIITGEPWQENEKNLVSIEEGVAKDLGIHLGDHLTFRVDNQQFTVIVKNIRQVDWQSMRPNFFMIFSPDVLNPFIVSWMTSLKVPESAISAEVELARAFPTITSLNIDSILTKLQTVLDKVAKAVTLLMMLVVIAAMLVLIVQWMSGMQQRQTSLVLMRTLGAKKQILQRMIYWQAILLGAFAGIAAAFSCEVIRWWTQSQWSEQDWSPLPLLWWLLPLLGCVVVVSVSLFTLQPLLNKTLYGRLRSL